MRYAGLVNQQAIEWGFEKARPGVKLSKIDEAIENVIRGRGCKPAFKGYQPDGYPVPFPACACISPNEVVVHGVPGDYILRDGDLLTIDVGSSYQGFFVDAARSRVIGDVSQAKQAVELVEATEAILAAQLSTVKNQCDFLTMVKAAEAEAIRRKVVIMPQWGGHGIADQIHMDPFIPSAVDRRKPALSQRIEERKLARQKLTTGQTICLEPVVTFGSADIIVDGDQWTVRKTDGLLAAHTERCILVTEDGYELLS